MSKLRLVCGSFETVEEVLAFDEFQQENLIKVLFRTHWVYQLHETFAGAVGPGYRIRVFTKTNDGWRGVTIETANNQLRAIMFDLSVRAQDQINRSANRRSKTRYIDKYEFPKRHATNRHPIYPYGDH